MIISSQQVRLAAAYLQDTQRGLAAAPYEAGSSAVPAELVAKVRETVALLPDTRDDRVEQGRLHFEGPWPSGSEVAEKMIGRIISDSIR